MTRKQKLYNKAGELSAKIGRERIGTWTGTTILFWEKQVDKLERNIINREKNFNRARRLADESRVGLKIPDIILGTSNETWKKEVRRIQMRVRRAEQKVTAVKIANIRANRQATQRAVQDVEQKVTQRAEQLEQRAIQVRQGIEDDRKTFDRLIGANEFQKVLDIVINDDKVLTQKQAGVFWNNLRGDARYTLLIKRSDEPDQHIPVNETTINFIIDILVNGRIIFTVPDWGSDILNNIIVADIDALILNKLPAPTRIIANKDGRFFPFINTTNLDLLQYQIFNQENAYDEKLLDKREHCILYSLKQCGVDIALINQVKMSFVSGCNVRKSDLPKIAAIIRQNIIICSMKPCGTIKKTTVKSPGISKGNVHIAIYENHYFKFEETIYSKFLIDNYDELKNERDKEDIIRRNNKTGFIRDESKSKINSLLMVHKLHNQGHFKKLDLVKFDETAKHSELKKHIYLGNIENEQKEMKRVKHVPYDRVKTPIYYADCETFVTGEKHELQLLGVVSSNSDVVNIYDVCDNIYQGKEVSKEQLVVFEFLNTLTGGGKHNALCYFHNLKYDYNVLEKYLSPLKKCEKDKIVYNCMLLYKGREVELRDSYKIIPFRLEQFQKEFSLPKEFGKKEALAYEYYTVENHNQVVNTDDYMKLLPISKQAIFKHNMLSEPSYNSENGTFNPLKYYKEYLRLDCLVLKKGVEKMNDTISEITEGKMSVYERLTISSLTDHYMIEEGAYDGVYSMQGNLRAYVASAIFGGRVCANPKYTKTLVEGKISDYDGVSLYPSAINRLCREIGLPIGKAVRFTEETLTDWEKMTYSIVTVKITKVNKKQQMPFIAHKSEDKSIEYTNEPPDEPITVDSITLQDYIKFHEIEYEILDGVYWNNGSNKKIGAVIQRLFEARLKYKKTNVALANTIKLMLNSAYGKTMMKKSMTESLMIKAKKMRKNKKTGLWENVKKTPFMDYVYNNFNTIKSYRRVNENIWEVERVCSDNSYNRGHIGCAILSMSKRIMNEVFDVANSNELPIYYTDTDSIHCNLADVPTLEVKYKEEYGKELNGKNLEQFHTDFNLDGAVSEIYATKSIFLGKKSYIDILESTDKDGNTITGVHMRMKGITGEGLNNSAKEYSDGHFGLYKDLASGTKKKIVLNPYNPDDNSKKVMFEFKNGSVKTRKEFAREVSF